MQLHFVLALNVNGAVIVPFADTFSDSFAAREVDVSCFNIVQPDPAVTVPVKLLLMPSPLTASSFADVVLGVGPHEGLALEPCPDAIWSNGDELFNPLYSYTAI